MAAVGSAVAARPVNVRKVVMRVPVGMSASFSVWNGVFPGFSTSGIDLSQFLPDLAETTIVVNALQSVCVGLTNQCLANTKSLTHIIVCPGVPLFPRRLILAQSVVPAPSLTARSVIEAESLVLPKWPLILLMNFKICLRVVPPREVLFSSWLDLTSFESPLNPVDMDVDLSS